MVYPSTGVCETDCLMCGVSEPEAAVVAAGGDCPALQVLQVRQRLALNVPRIIHQTAAPQSDGVLWPMMTHRVSQ